MMKPEFSKPFDIEHARAGAPISTVGGDAVEILKWTYRVSEGVNHILGLILTSSCEIPSSWKFDGTMPHGYANSAERYLVMLPLGLIDGKPVFVGDEVEYETFTGWGRTPVSAEWRDFGKCRWPAPAKVYPEYSGDLNELRKQYNAVLGEEMGWCLLRVANAALRHAVDSNQVVPVADVMEVARSLSKRGRTERDMAIAAAMRSAAYAQAMNCQSGHEGTVIRLIDLATVISTVK